MIHHRTPQFSAELATICELLRPVFGTRAAVLPVHTTGRGAMEAAICNLFSPGDEIAVCCNGKFGEMWAGFAESYGLVVRRVATDWTRDIDPNEIDDLTRRRPGVRAIALTYVDTSTGVRNDIAAMCALARSRDLLVLVDGVSSIGGMPFAFDQWGVDVAITTSQKCLMASPGLAFAVLSDRAWAAREQARLPRNYWDFGAIRDEVSQARPETPGTSPVHLVLQVAESLRLIHEEGLGAVYERHERMAARVRGGIAALGLALQYPRFRAFGATVTAIALPAGVAPRRVRDGLIARGILTAAAMEPLAGSGFRIGHMGDIRLADVERTLAALADVLNEIRISPAVDALPASVASSVPVAATAPAPASGTRPR
jgi:aspartate aminotransferase-like enzyme